MYLYQEEEKRLLTLSPREDICFLNDMVFENGRVLKGWLKIYVTRVDASLWRIEFYDMDERVTTIETWSARSVIRFLEFVTPEEAKEWMREDEIYLSNCL